MSKLTTTEPSWSDKLEELLSQFSKGKDAKGIQHMSMSMRNNVHCNVSQETENTIDAREGINSILSEVSLKGKRKASGIILQIDNSDIDKAMSDGGICLNSGTWYNDETDEEVEYWNVVFLDIEQMDSTLEGSFNEFGVAFKEYIRKNNERFQHQ